MFEQRIKEKRVKENQKKSDKNKNIQCGKHYEDLIEIWAK